MDRATSGSIMVGGREITGLNEEELTGYRREDVGFGIPVLQSDAQSDRIGECGTAQQVCKNPLKPSEVLEQVGLRDRMHNFPAQLSGGEQQRVSIARALCKNPALLLVTAYRRP
jgi:putative ABC transport system ATP-binding protein